MSNSSVPRRIVYSQALLKRIGQLGEKAKKQGRGKEFLAALQSLQKLLQVRPLPPLDRPDVFGDPCYSLKNMGLQVCVGTVAPLVVYFGISQEPQVIQEESFIGVYVLTCNLLPWEPD